jgi:inhibitor of the pro-sigma K processing machinery
VCVDSFTWGIVIIGIVCMIAFLSQLKWSPIHWVGKGAIHLVIGVVFLFVINLFGGIFEFQLPLNVITVAIAGFLGIPGVIALVCIKLFIV